MSTFHTETLILGTHNGRILDDGSRCQTEIIPPLHIPIEAKSAGIKLRNSYIWNTFVNIDPVLGNRLTLISDPGGTLESRYDIIYPSGQYSLDEFNSFFTRESIRLRAPWVDKDSGQSDLNFEPDMAVQKVYVSNKSLSTYHISWLRDSGSTYLIPLYKLLGFEAETVTVLPPASDLEPYSFTYAEKEANFNFVNSVLILCNLVSKGLRNGGRMQSILAQVPITEDPGSLMVYEPQHSLISEPTLPGTTIRSIELTLTNENGELIRTPGNPWQVTVEISYEMYNH